MPCYSHVARYNSAQVVPKERSGQQKMITAIIFWIVLGLIAGVLAKLIMPGDDPGGIIVTIIIGIVGGLLGGFIGQLLGFGGVTGFNLGSIFWAIIGAVILLAIYRLVAPRRV